MIKYKFSTKIWKYDSPGGWYFVPLPKNISKEIRESFKYLEEGWGKMKALAKIGEFDWKSAIWFDTKMDTYLLPVKAESRKKSHLEINQNIKCIIWI